MKRVISLLLATLMLLTVCIGCGSKEENKSSTSSAATTGTTETDKSASGETTAKASTDEEEVTWDSPNLTWKKDTSPVTYSLFLDIPWSPVDVWGTDHVSQEVTRRTGVSFEVTKAQDRNHLGLLLASGDLPDSIFVYEKKERFETSTVSQPWDELIPKYAPEFDKLIGDDEKALATVEDGHYYTLYTHNRNQAYWDDPTLPVSYGEPTIMLRDDIMEELGNPKIETVDDFYNVLKQVKEKHPDYIPFLQPNQNGSALAGWFGINTAGAWYIDKNGKVGLPQADREHYYPYLKYMNKLSREGLLSTEGLTYDFNKQKQAILAGKVFATAGQIYDVDLINEELDKIPGNTLRYTAMNKPLKVDGEIKYSPVYTNSGFAGFYITQNCKEPGRLIALMEFMKSPEGDKLTQWGVEGVDYTLTEDGLPLMDDSISWKERGDNVWYFQASFIVEAMKVMTKKETAPKYAQVTSLMYDFKPYWKVDYALALTKVLPESEEADILSSITNTFSNTVNSIILAEDDSTFEKRFNAMFDEIESLGLSKLLEYAQAQYEKYKPRFEK